MSRLDNIKQWWGTKGVYISYWILIVLIIVVFTLVSVTPFVIKMKMNHINEVHFLEDTHEQELDLMQIKLNNQMDRILELQKDNDILEEINTNLKETIDILEKTLIDLENRIKELESIKILSMEATAYTDNVASQGKWVGQTATGVKPQEGIIAVDPKVIPLGSRVEVEGFGILKAMDTGGAIKGNRIDIFMNTEQACRSFGRRRLKVRVLD